MLRCKTAMPQGESCGTKFAVMSRLEIACLSINSAVVRSNASSTIVFNIMSDAIN